MDKLKPEQVTALLETLRDRFETHMHRHPHLKWDTVKERCEAAPEKLWSLHEMERTGGEPDVVGGREPSGEILFFDCSAESPKGRRSLCYDAAALESRKANKPEGSAQAMALSMGITLLSEEQYHRLQAVGEFDCKTSSWLQTPEPVRRRGGSIFGDRRFGRVFIYHNGAESYYAARGFRGALKT